MTTESVFLSRSDVDLDGSSRCMRFLQMHGLADELVPWLMDGHSLELVFDDKRLTAAREWWDDDGRDVPVRGGGEAIRLEDVPQWPLYRLVRSRSRTGSHIGGRAPAGFVPPTADHVAPFQYLGTLTPALAGLEWLPFELHLSAPTLNGYHELYIDCRDPLKPELLHEERSALRDFDFVDEVLTLDTVRDMTLGFRTIHLRSVPTDRWQLDASTMGHAGIPHWIQQTVLPVCPSSGEPMWFVCEFSYSLFTDVVSCTTLSVEKLNDHMRFDLFPSATLYVFLAPGSRIGCIVCQTD